MKYDAVIVLGKNVGYFGSKNKIRKSKNFLSRKSEVNVFAAGLIVKNNISDKLIFCGGKTAGKDYPSEAEAMKRFLLEKFPEISEDSLLLEEESMDTKQNAEFSKKIIEANEFSNIAFLTTSSHIPRSKKLFKKAGLILDSLSSQEIVSEFAPDIYKEYKNEFGKSEIVLEKIADFLQSLPIYGTLGDKFIEKRRSINFLF